MPKLFKYLLDFAAMALLYFLWHCPKWKRAGECELEVNTVMLLYLSGVLLVTLMPIIASLLLDNNNLNSQEGYIETV